MTRRQLFAVIAINAVISLVIAVGVVLVAFGLGGRQTFSAPTPAPAVAGGAPTPPTPTATATPSPAPTMATEEYVVQPGDTLLGIALRLDVNEQVLLALNDLPDANRLLVGQRLRVPLGTLPTPTPLPSATATRLPRGTATPTRAAITAAPTIAAITATTALSPSVAVTGTLELPGTGPALAIVAVTGPGDLTTEAVRVVNGGAEAVRLRNWTLVRADGRRYGFPDVTLEPGEALWVHSRRGVDSLGNLFWGLTQSAWQQGDTVALVDQAGNPVSVFIIGE